MNGVTYTLEHHGDGRGLDATMIEIRHDEILEPAGVSLWADAAGTLPRSRTRGVRRGVRRLNCWGQHGGIHDRHTGGREIRDPRQGYFEKRGLQRYAGVWSLWALGVGAVISGHFSGWNFGFATGGWGGMLVAGIIIAIMYLGLVFSIAEMSPALPHTGAAYSFARTAMGPWGGFVTGLFENVEYVITPAVIVHLHRRLSSARSAGIDVGALPGPLGRCSTPSSSRSTSSAWRSATR